MTQMKQLATTATQPTQNLAANNTGTIRQ